MPISNIDDKKGQLWNQNGDENGRNDWLLKSAEIVDITVSHLRPEPDLEMHWTFLMKKKSFKEHIQRTKSNFAYFG